MLVPPLRCRVRAMFVMCRIGLQEGPMRGARLEKEAEWKRVKRVVTMLMDICCCSETLLIAAIMAITAAPGYREREMSFRNV